MRATPRGQRAREACDAMRKMKKKKERMWRNVLAVVLLLGVLGSVGGLLLAFAIEDYKTIPDSCIVVNYTIRYKEYNDNDCYYGIISFTTNKNNNMIVFNRTLNIQDVCACASHKKVMKYILQNFQIGKSYNCYVGSTIAFSQPNKIFNLLCGILFSTAFLVVIIGFLLTLKN